MRDYRLPKASHSRLRGKPSRRRPSELSRTSSPKSSSSKWSFGAFFLAVFLLLVLLSLVGYGLLAVAVPRLFPLNQAKNIVIVSSSKDEEVKEIFIAHYRPDTGGITAVKVPANQAIPVIGGFGEYPLRSVLPLLTMEKKDSTFIRSAFSYATGEIIDGVVITDKKTMPNSQDDLKRVLRQSGFNQEIEGLTWQDQLSLFFFTAHAPSDKFSLKSLDSWQAWEAQRGKLALQFPEDECSVAVVNATDQPGLATAVSSLIEQSGFSVVRVTDSSDKQAESRIFYDRSTDACTSKAEKMGRIFPAQVQIQPDSVQSQNYRAKIILELGADLKGVIPKGD